MAEERTKRALIEMGKLLEITERMADKANEGLKLYADLTESIIDVRFPLEGPVVTLFKTLIEIHTRSSKRIFDSAKRLQKRLEDKLIPDDAPPTPPAGGSMKN